MPGRSGALAEYVRSTKNVGRATSQAQLRTQAWQVSGGWVLTGSEIIHEHHADHPLDGTTTGGLGALELVARYGVLTTDPAAFPTFADPATQPRRARAAAWGSTGDSRAGSCSR